MTASGSDPPSLSGELHVLPFLQDPYAADSPGSRTAAGTHGTPSDAYDALTTEFGADRVLVLKRYPANTERVDDRLAAAVDSVERPDVRVLARHARRVLEAGSATYGVLSRDERRVALRDFLETHTWNAGYLQRAAEQPSFLADFGRFVTEASYQPRPDNVDDPVLTELYDAVESFHSFLEGGAGGDRSVPLLDRSAVVRTATERLREEPATRSAIRDRFDAVLALEFEEFGPGGRAYLAELVGDARLVAFAQRGAAIRRIWTEAGEITDHCDGMAVIEHGDSDPIQPLPSLAYFLTTGEGPTPSLDDTVRRIHEPTFREHVETVGGEIERFAQGRGPRGEAYSYDDFAVVLRDGNAPIAKTMKLLRGMGIPTKSAAVDGFEHDPTARELLAVARVLADAERRDGSTPDWGARVREAGELRVARSAGTIEGERDALRTLLARVEGGLDAARPGEIVACALEAAATADTVRAGLWRWIVYSNLKRRIAATEDVLGARLGFDRVESVAEIAAFVAGQDTSRGWARLVTELEAKFDREAGREYVEEVDLVEGGVLVDAARSVKTGSFNIVFLVDVVEGEYPVDPQFTSLFPTDRLRTMTGYPALTDPSREDVTDTFDPADGAGQATRRPLEAYYAGASRRMLAIGAQAADEGLYIGTYERRDELGRRRQPSRLLDGIESRFGELLAHDEAAVDSDPREFAVDRLPETLDRLQRAGTTEEAVAMDDIEAAFGAVQHLLDGDPPEDLERAVATQRDLARGVIQRE